jgi:predicted MPP superfamily phosphohydrolase
VEQLRADQRLSAHANGAGIHILHLSDLHLENEEQAQVYRTQLETDLIHELDVKRLGYLVLSGDVANVATEGEYKAAFALLDGLVKRFSLDPSRVVLVPGNHDLNWGLSRRAYPFVYRDELSAPPEKGTYIAAGDEGVLLRKDELYQQRFAPFSDQFYRRAYGGQAYPLAYGEQTLFVEREEDRFLFLGLNSSWHVDHHYRDRAGIHMGALRQALDRLLDGAYDGWLKIAVWHHPVTGRQGMNDDFLQLLTVHGFQICMHGHIHEAIEGYHKYDDRRGVRIIGAGTFGAPANEQVTGIPLQYNLLTFSPETGVMVVRTRKKEKPNGAWSADARWGSKNDPKAWYRFTVRNYQKR